MYGSKHLGSIKSLGAALMVFCTAVSPFLFGWLIDKGISMDVLAKASATYIFFTSALAIYACRLVKNNNMTNNGGPALKITKIE